jgi:hypothetical protein
MATTHRISGPLVSALEATWASIVRRHPEVPKAVLVVASGTDGRKATEPRWGHFAALRRVQGDAQLPEVLVAGEGLIRGAEPVLATLLHEAAHGLAHVRRISDTSRQGRYHNRRYKALAEELGLDVAEVGTIGWSSTTLRASTVQTYRRELDRLQAALTLYRRAEPTAGGTRSKSTNLLPCSCTCPRRIRVARSTLDAGPIVCGICEQDFAPDIPD